MIKKIITTCIGLMLGLALFGVGLIAIAILVTYPKLPSLDSLQHYQPKMPLTVYSSDGQVIGLYGEERRNFTKIKDFPKVLKDAVIAAEDKRFYEHWGVDVLGVARALIGNVVAGGVQSGASTITQQVAKNFYLSNERTFSRKFNEALLAYKIEQSMSKDQILELYFNQIYLGQRAYGFAAAAQIYYNKNVKDLTLGEASMLAGLPKAPSAYNPIVNPERAKLRQEYILNNMVEEKMITPQERDEALKEELHYERFVQKIDQNALYVAEMVRQELYEKYGEEAYTQGFKVYTTVNIENQRVATEALRKVLRNFDRGSSYRGAENYLDLSKSDNVEETVGQYLSSVYTVDKMVPAVVLEASGKGIEIQLPSGRKVTLNHGSLGFAARAVNNKKMGDDRIRRGSVIRVKSTGKGWTVVQEPSLQGALVSLDAKTGAVRALVGGYDFYSKTFNRATQAMRQPGSSFKPFVYSAALAKGMTASTQINDAPQVIDPRNAYIMYRIMQDVVRYGTARGALSIGRSDIAGKTGTTNDNKDAWFVGFNPSVVTAVYVGFDKPRSMGRAGYGGTIALPVWVDYMRFALKGTESKGMKVPEGIVAKGGEYYMKERLVTSPELTLDNSGSVPRPAAGRPRSPADEDGAPRRRSSGQADSSDNQGEVPVNPTNSGGNNKQLDSLF